VGHNASRDRAGKVEQPRRQEINTVGRLVDDLVEHVEHLAHQLIRILTQTRRGLAQARAAPADRASGPGSHASDGVAQEPQISVRGSVRGAGAAIGRTPHVVTRHVNGGLGAGHRRVPLIPRIRSP
jgi:hypothetical protein